MLKLKGEGEINIGEKTRPYRINGRALGLFFELAGDDWRNFYNLIKVYGDGGKSYHGLRRLIYAGLCAGVHPARPDFTYENVCDWCDELTSEDEGRFIGTVVIATQSAMEEAGLIAGQSEKAGQSENDSEKNGGTQEKKTLSGEHMNLQSQG